MHRRARKRRLPPARRSRLTRLRKGSDTANARTIDLASGCFMMRSAVRAATAATMSGCSHAGDERNGSITDREYWGPEIRCEPREDRYERPRVLDCRAERLAERDDDIDGAHEVVEEGGHLFVVLGCHPVSVARFPTILRICPSRLAGSLMSVAESLMIPATSPGSLPDCGRQA